MSSRLHTCSIVIFTLGASAAACSSSDPATPSGSAGAAGATVAGAGSSGVAGSAGSLPGAGGASAGANSGGASGAAGAATGGAGGASGGTSASAGAAGGAAVPGCPAGALFCADFEEASGPPTGATLQDPDETGGGATFATLMKLDTVAPFAGKQSLAVTSSGGFQIRMLGVPVPSAFWVRLFIKSDQDIGQPDHNTFFQAMTDPNYHDSSTTIEVAEQFSCVLLNMKDMLYPTGTTCTVNTPLAKNTWHCMEAHFDGAAGNVTVFADKTKIIDAVAWPSAKANLNTFEFGYASYHAPAATVWYDNVAITTAQVGCP